MTIACLPWVPGPCCPQHHPNLLGAPQAFVPVLLQRVSDLESHILSAGCPTLHQATLINEYSSVVQPVQLAFQQQIQTLKTQHEEFVNSLAQQQQQQQPQPQIQMPQMEAEVKATPPPPAPPPAPTPAPAIPPTTQPGTWLPQHLPPGGSLRKAVSSPRKGSGSVVSGPIQRADFNLFTSTRQVISQVSVTTPLQLRQFSCTNHPREWFPRERKALQVIFRG